MSAQNMVWVVLNSQIVVNEIRARLDEGSFSEINQILASIKAFDEKLKSLVQEHGGHIYVMLYERVVLELPLSIAEQLPDMVAEYKKQVGPDVSCGMGMDYEEAMKACLQSVQTGQIELYGEETAKADEWEGNQNALEISPNLFNPEMQRTVNPIPAKPDEEKKAPVLRPGIEEDLNMDAQYIQALGQTLGAGQQPQPQPGQEGQEGEEEEDPQDLREALNGGKVDGYSPEEEGEEKEGGKKSKKKEKSEDGESDDDEEEGEDGEESGESHEKLAASLLNIRDRIPELITLADKNPEAFKQSVAMIQKLIGLARSKKKETKKSEIDSINAKLDELTKGMKYPIGTRKGRRVKVIIDGKAVWRSMSAGRVQDARGQAISVKSHNAAATSGSQEEQ